VPSGNPGHALERSLSVPSSEGCQAGCRRESACRVRRGFRCRVIRCRASGRRDHDSDRRARDGR
jgi:hypothetical protein